MSRSTDQGAISVGLTTCNGARFIEQQLESILAGTLLPDEIVVCDDASGDETLEIVNRIAAHAPVPMRVHRQRQRVGLGRNFETLLSLCVGEVVVLADQDDIWEPGKLAVVAEAFKDHAVALWLSDAMLIDESARVLGDSLWYAIGFHHAQQDALRRGRGLGRLIHGSTATGCCMAFRAAIVDFALPFPAQIGDGDGLFFQDAWLALLGALTGEVRLEPTQLTRYRQHGSQVTQMALVPSARAAAAQRGPAEQLRIDYGRANLVAERCRRPDVREACRRERLEELLDLERFLAVRLLARGTRGRAREIGRQLACGAYRRYAGGLRTALRDLLLAT